MSDSTWFLFYWSSHIETLEITLENWKIKESRNSALFWNKQVYVNKIKAEIKEEAIQH